MTDGRDDLRAALLEKVRRLMDATFLTESSEEEMYSLMDEVCRLSPDPYVCGYIFHTKGYNTPEQVVEKVMEYKPICLPDQSVPSGEA